MRVFYSHISQKRNNNLQKKPIFAKNITYFIQYMCTIYKID
jgi:hypothetical protein